MKDNLEHIFKEFENKFDVEEPTIGHFNRFEKKLNSTSSNKPFIKRFFINIAIAASIILFVGISIGKSINSNIGFELAQVSSEMEETQSFFLTTIENNLEAIENERNNDTEILINDALNQLQKLEKQYKKLSLELKESTEDKRIIYSMISNFQQRIELLQTLLQQIENVKQLKLQSDEIYV